MSMLLPAWMWSRTTPFWMLSMFISESSSQTWMPSSIRIRAMRMYLPFLTCFQ